MILGSISDTMLKANFAWMFQYQFSGVRFLYKPDTDEANNIPADPR